MLRTSLCAVGTGILVFAGVALLPHPRAMARTGGGGGAPSPTPIAIYATAESGELDCSWTSGWSASVVCSGDYVETYGGGYYTSSCTATSANGGSASYSSQLSITLENGTGASAVGDWTGFKSVNDYVYGPSPSDDAQSSVTGGSEPSISGEAYNPDNTAFQLTSTEYDDCATMTLANGAQQSFPNWLTLAGSANGSFD